MTQALEHLHRLYAHTDDPWNFDSSDYEQEKFTATCEALSQSYYEIALEIGCGNGALARHLAPRCNRYVGMDAVPRAVGAARQKVPSAEFAVATYPCPLPLKNCDLVVLSEFLYFLSPSDIARLCNDLINGSPEAEILCITYLGDTEQALQGSESLDLFARGMASTLRLETVKNTSCYRIDRGVMGQIA